MTCASEKRTTIWKAIRSEINTPDMKRKMELEHNVIRAIVKAQKHVRIREDGCTLHLELSEIGVKRFWGAGDNHVARSNALGRNEWRKK